MYFGWFVVAGSALIYMLVVGTTATSFGVFVVPVSQDLGLSRATANTALILFNAGNALWAPLVGRLIDRVPVRPVMLVGAVLVGGSFLALSQAHSLWLSALVIAVPLALGNLASGTLSCSVLLARWFTALRGRAMVLAALGMSGASLTVTPALGWLVQTYGWRTTLTIEGCVVTVLLLGIAAAMRDRPREDEVERGWGKAAVAATPPLAGAAADQAAAAAAHTRRPVAVRAVLSTPLFWAVGISSATVFGIVASLAISIVPVGIASGLSPVAAAGLLSIAGIVAIASKLLFAVVADRTDRVLVLVGLFLLTGVANALMLLGHSYAILALCAAVLGLASGMLAPLFYALVADKFGIGSFGTVRGLLSLLSAVFSAAILRTTGEVYDRTGGYDLVFIGFTGACVAAALLMLSSRLCTRRAGGPVPVIA